MFVDATTKQSMCTKKRTKCMPLGTISVVQLTMTIESDAQSENLFVGKCAD
jgi:hypothetical protein